MQAGVLEKVSLRGRVAFAIRCFENTLLELHYNVNEWKRVLEELWKFTDIKYLDDWSGMVSEIIPDNLLEFRTYEEHDFDYLDEKTFIYLYNLYQKNDENIDILMTSIYNIGTSHAYSVIVGCGKESLYEVELLIKYMTSKGISMPDVKDFEQFSIKENEGWGNKFEGKVISCIL